MIRVKIKVKNDHRSLTEDFECSELLLSPDSEQIKIWIEKVTKDFKDPVEEVTVKSTMYL